MEGKGLNHLFTQHLFILKIKITPMARNNAFLLFFFLIFRFQKLGDTGKAWEGSSVSGGCFFTQYFLQLHLQTTVPALFLATEPFLVFPKLPQKLRHKIFLTLQQNPTHPSLPAWALLPQMGSRTEIISQRKKKITKLLRAALKF